jgi:hypothetical protein
MKTTIERLGDDLDFPPIRVTPWLSRDDAKRAYAEWHPTIRATTKALAEGRHARAKIAYGGRFRDGRFEEPGFNPRLDSRR